MTRLFRVTQKWMYDKYRLYIELVILPNLFKTTFVPRRYLITDKGKQSRKINFDIKLVNEWIHKMVTK